MTQSWESKIFIYEYLDALLWVTEMLTTQISKDLSLRQEVVDQKKGGKSSWRTLISLNANLGEREGGKQQIL